VRVLPAWRPDGRQLGWPTLNNLLNPTR
jgi:hypothetical protein